MIRIGVIGAGLRASHLVKLMALQDPAICVSAVVDTARLEAEKRFAEATIEANNIRWFADTDQLLSDQVAGELDAVLIGTRCNTHAELACKIADLRIPILLEKPVGISQPQIEMLSTAFQGRHETVVVSFPLRFSPLFRKARDLVRRGRLGKINQITATNFVPYGGVYFADWYRDSDLTGGMWLQKATHDFDYICELAMSAPEGIMAVETQRIFGGEMPEDLTCSKCDLTAQCEESPQNIAIRGDDGGMGTEDHRCAFSSSIKNHDAGSALITFANGVHASYAQNFASRRSAFQRGARVTGYDATLTFDWATGSIEVIEHQGKAVEIVKIEAGEDHHGGDTELIRNFLDVIRGESTSLAPLEYGLQSATLCLAARESVSSNTFQRYQLPRPSTRFDDAPQLPAKASAIQSTRPSQTSN